MDRHPPMRRTEVWAKLMLSDQDAGRLHDFFVREFNVKPGRIVSSMHITVYHCRRPMRGLAPLSEAAHVVLPVADTRFMVMVPGGENPRPELNPALLTVGIRVHRQSDVLQEIRQYRRRLLEFETPHVLGRRPPSSDKWSAFGARAFQPHMSILRPGSHVDRNLNHIGALFRDTIGDLTFDRFVVEIQSK